MVIAVDDDFERAYSEDEQRWLDCFQQNPLLHRHPLCWLLVQYFAQIKQWTAEQQLEACQLRSVELLFQAIELPVTTKARVLCEQVTALRSELELVSYVLLELEALYQCFKQGHFEALNEQQVPHSVKAFLGLGELLNQHPELVNARFIQRRQDSDFDFRMAAFTAARIIHQTKILAMDDLTQRVRRCRHRKDLERLEQSLSRLTQEKIVAL